MPQHFNVQCLRCIRAAPRVRLLQAVAVAPIGVALWQPADQVPNPQDRAGWSIMIAADYTKQIAINESPVHRMACQPVGPSISPI